MLGATKGEKTIVVLRISSGQDGTLKPKSIQPVSKVGGRELAVQNAYRSTITAVRRCFRDGVDLPVDKYDLWKIVKLQFNPDAMQRK